MKKIIMVGGIFTICFLMSMQGMAQQNYSIVYDLYYRLILNPESGDQLINSNTAVFDSNFYSCLSEVRQKALQAGQQHDQYCAGKVDPNEKAKCLQNNEASKIWRWTNEIEPVCKDNGLWSQTLTGSATIVGKRHMDQLLPGQWEQIIKSTLPQWRHLFVCQ